MIKNIYRIIILNEKNSFNRNINVHDKLLKIIIVIISIFFIFAAFGIYKIIFPNPQTVKFNNLLSLKRDTIELLKFLEKNKKIDQNTLSEFNLSGFFVSESELKPTNAPVDGIVTRGINLNENPPHNGIDIAAKFNSPVKAAQTGLVIFSGLLEDLGKTVILSHPNHYYSLYAHLNKIHVYQRQHIKINEQIGIIGQSGNSDGPHLHFEIWQNSNIIDPRELIKEYQLKDVSVK